MPLFDRDAGFCSGGSEIGDDYQSERLQNSPTCPTDTSEDSIEIKLCPIVIPKTKRKANDSAENDVPLKKRIKYDSMFGKTSHSDNNNSSDSTSINSNPFRPWIPSDGNIAEILPRHPGVTTLHRASKDIVSHHTQEQPLALITKKNVGKVPNVCVVGNTLVESTSRQKIEEHKVDAETRKTLAKQSNSDKGKKGGAHARSASQRNYKNMTRERRIEANARERTRVHTISAAFDTLRRSVPSYSSTQKLSKLSVLRIACAYIVMLSRMNGEDYSIDQSEPSIPTCLDDVTKTIQTEGKVRKKKDEL